MHQDEIRAHQIIHRRLKKIRVFEVTQKDNVESDSEAENNLSRPVFFFVSGESEKKSREQKVGYEGSEYYQNIGGSPPRIEEQ